MKPAKKPIGDLSTGKVSPAGRADHGQEPLESVAPSLVDLRYIFLAPPRFLVGTTVPETVYLQLLNYPGSISKFYEDAVNSFDGDLHALVEAAAQFMEERRRIAKESPPRNANGRVLKATYQKIEELRGSLSGIRGMSRAKVLAGLIFLKFRQISE